MYISVKPIINNRLQRGNIVFNNINNFFMRNRPKSYVDCTYESVL